MSLLPRALLVNDPLSPLGKLVVREEEAASDPYASFYTNTSVKLSNSVSTFITEADCRQHKSNGTAQQPVPQVLPPSSPEAQGAVAVPPMFAVGQKWKRRDGKVIFIKRVDETSVPVQGDDTYWRYPNGKSLDAMLAWDLVELIADVSPSKPTEDSEGWRDWGVGDPPSEGDLYQVVRRDGSSFGIVGKPAVALLWADPCYSGWKVKQQ